MIASSRPVKLVALGFAVLAHAALALALSGEEVAQIEGTSGSAEVRLGSGFADMVAGTVSAEQAETVPAEAPPEPSQAVAALRPEAAQPAAAVQPIRPVAAQPEVAEVLAPRATPETAPPLEAQTAAVAPLRPTEALTARPPAASAQQVSDAPETTEVTRSPRPQRRSAAFEQKHDPARPVAKPPPAATEARNRPSAPPPAARQGNAAHTARAGAVAGSETARARSSGSGGESQSAGTAAASNYPGLVMRRISRAGKPRVRARGAAVVAFSVSAGGGLAGLALARSSGSAALDEAALRIVRRAAPFPEPPAGARRSFSIRIEGR